MKITIRDVAVRAGVSHTTVSMVINNDSRITQETKGKVMKVIKEMDFHPSESARSLARGNSNIISFITVMHVSPFISGILEGVETQAYDLNRYEYSIEPRSTRKSPAVKKSMLEEIMYGRQARAIIILGEKPSEKIVQEFKVRNIPIVLVENRVKGAHSVRLDNFGGAYRAVQYLISKGRKKIGLISADMAPLFEDVEVYSSAAERFEGYKKALDDNGIEFDEKLVMPAHTFSYEEGKDAMNSYLDRGLKPDAILSAAGDMTAIGAMEQAEVRGIKAPEDIAIVGFDDLFLSKFVRPSLTSVRQPIKQMGREVFDIVIAAIEGKLKEDRDIVFEPELIVRESA